MVLMTTSMPDSLPCFGVTLIGEFIITVDGFVTTLSKLATD